LRPCRSRTSEAFVAKDKYPVQAGDRGPAGVPVPVNAKTKTDEPHVAEKSGSPKSIEPTGSEHELAKVDISAPKGVQDVQAMTYAWSRRNLIAAYIMYVLLWLDAGSS
jgi:hypothetical protein